LGKEKSNQRNLTVQALLKSEHPEALKAKETAPNSSLGSKVGAHADIVQDIAQVFLLLIKG